MYVECCSWLFVWIESCSYVILYIKWCSCMLLWDVESTEEEIVLYVLDIFHAILVHNYDDQTSEFVENLICNSWFTFSLSCLALYPTERVKRQIYLMMSSLIEVLLEDDCVRQIRDAVSYLPSDPKWFAVSARATELPWSAIIFLSICSFTNFVLQFFVWWKWLNQLGLRFDFRFT